jgi:hypothetical protein
MDSDDVCPPDRLEKQIEFLDVHPECVFLTTSYGIVTPNGKYLAPDLAQHWHYVQPSDITFGTRLFCDAASIYKREPAVSLSYDESLPVESPLWYRLLDHGKAVLFEEPLYYVRWRMGSLSRGQLNNSHEIHRGVRVKYDPTNAKGLTAEKSGKANLKNEKRAVYFCAAAGDLPAARKTAVAVWKKYPFSLISFKLLFAASGLQRLKRVEGACKTMFSAVNDPIVEGA